MRLILAVRVMLGEPTCVCTNHTGKSKWWGGREIQTRASCRPPPAPHPITARARNQSYCSNLLVESSMPMKTQPCRLRVSQSLALPLSVSISSLPSSQFLLQKAKGPSIVLTALNCYSCSSCHSCQRPIVSVKSVVAVCTNKVVYFYPCFMIYWIRRALARCLPSWEENLCKRKRHIRPPKGTRHQGVAHKETQKEGKGGKPSGTGTPAAFFSCQGSPIASCASSRCRGSACPSS